MIAGCPKCAARYRIDRDKLVDGAVRLRCTKCEAVFRVRAPEEPTEPPQPAAPISAPAPVAAPPPQPVVAEAPAAPAPVAPATPTATGPCVLVATPDTDLAKQTSELLAASGYAPVVVHDGSQAMLEIQRKLPSAVVLAADLPKMFGFQVCEVVQRNESLNHIHVVLVGAIHHPDRYRRPAEEIYGADAYLEAPDLPGGLLPILEQAGIRAAGVPDTAAAPAPVPAPVEVPAPPAIGTDEFAIGTEPPLEIDSPPQPLAPAPPKASAPPRVQPAAAEEPVDGLGEERAAAERLARIIVSDIILYNEDKFTQCIAAGNVAEVLGPDLVEGRGLFEGRIDPRVRGDRDYLMDELIRVARSRGME